MKSNSLKTPTAPFDFSQDEAAIWSKICESEKPGYFARSAMRNLLEGYCRWHILELRLLARFELNDDPADLKLANVAGGRSQTNFTAMRLSINQRIARKVCKDEQPGREGFTSGQYGKKVGAMLDNLNPGASH